MEHKNILIKIKRDHRSYDYKKDPQKNDFQNNTKNNCLDRMTVSVDEAVVFYCDSVQTVSNHPLMDFMDTISSGKFQIECFVDPGQFGQSIHGIINAKDIENQPIGEHSRQMENGISKGRWLVHSTWNPVNKVDYVSAWGGGCFIFKSTLLLTQFNLMLKRYGVNKGDILNGVLLEE